MKTGFKVGARICAIALFACVLAAPGKPVAASEAQKSPWGSEDEIGTLNAMTDRSKLDILRVVSDGRVYDLGVELFVGMPDCCSDAFGDPRYQIMMTHSPARAVGAEMVSHSSEAIFMNTHTGTHMDGLTHFGLNGKIWNGASAEDALGVRGWSKSGAEKFPPIIARGVLIDVAGSKDVERLPASYSVSVEDLEMALEKQGTELRTGDIVLVRTGQMTSWPDRTGRDLFQEPGIGLEAVKWLAEERKVMMLGADNFGLESFPTATPDNFAPVHTYLLAERGMPFFEMMWLEELAMDQIYEFLFVGAPLKLRGASGAPVRPLAIPIESEE